MRRTLLVLAVASLAACWAAGPPGAAASADLGAPKRASAPPPGDQVPAAPNRPSPATRPGALPAERGTITGVVRVAGAAGRPDICITAAPALASAAMASAAMAGAVMGGAVKASASPAMTGGGVWGGSTVRAGADGRFAISGLLMGRYKVRYHPCAAPLHAAGLAYADLLAGRPATRVTVRSGGPVRLAPVSLPPARRAGAGSSAPKTSFGRLRSAALAAARSASSGGSRPRPGLVTGTVTSKSGRPLSGVCVGAVSLGGRFGPQFYGATSSASGRYTIKVRTPGRYQVAFVAACGSTGNYAPQVWPGAATGARAHAIRVRAGREISKIDAALGVGATMTGRVRAGSASGPPLGGICVLAGGLGGQWLFGGYAVTGADGRFTMPSLGTGKYDVEFSSGCGGKGAYATKDLAEPVAVTDGEVTRGVDDYLVRDGLLTGTVTDSAGRPVAGICIFAAGVNVRWVGFGQTGANGRYTTFPMPPGLYDVYFDSCDNRGNLLPVDEPATVLSGQTTSLDAVMPTAGVITGKVIDARGRPLAGVCVEADGNDYGGYFARTGRDGTYRLRQLQPDSYQVLFSGGCGNPGSVAPQFYQGDAGPLAPTPVPVSAGQIATGIDAEMRPGATITGHVTSDSGARLSGICVSAFNGEPFYGGNGTSRAGAYRIANLAPGQYYLRFSCGGGQAASQWFLGERAWAESDLLFVRAGVTSGVNAVLPAAGAITGSVHDAAGRPLRRVCVGLVDAKDHLMALATTSKTGRYRLRGLQAGRYQVEFKTSQADGYPCSGAPYAAQWYPGRARQASAGRVTVATGRTTPGIDSVLEPGGVITGQVGYGTQRRPVNLVCVYAHNGLDNSAFALTDRRGRYVLRGLSAGSYTVDYQPCAAESALATGVRQARVTADLTTAGVNERLRAGGTITGVVRVRAGGQAGTAAGICVVAVPVAGSGSTNYWVTGDDGRYQLGNLAAGQYRIYAADPGCSFIGPGLVPRWHRGLVTVVAGTTTSGIDTVLGTTGAISGQVRAGPGGNPGGPVAGICVLALPARPGANPVIAITARTGGYFAGGGLPGSYLVKFEPGCGATGYQARWYPGVRDERHATPVRVRQAQDTAGINATLPRG